MSLVIKICGLRDAKTVDATVAAGADAIGFVFTKSIREVSTDEAIRASVNIPSGVRRIAVMKHPTDDEWQAVLKEYAPDVLQTDAADFASLSVPDAIERWPVYREGVSVPEAGTTYVYEGKKSGAGQTVDWSKAAPLSAVGNMILAGGLNAANVGHAIAAARPYGLDLSSGVESAPGEKDPELIEAFISAARAAEKNL